MLLFLSFVLIAHASTNAVTNGIFEPLGTISPWQRTPYNQGGLTTASLLTPDGTFKSALFNWSPLLISGISPTGQVATGKKNLLSAAGGSNIVQQITLPICPGNTFSADIATSSPIQIADTRFAFVWGTSSADAGLLQGTVVDIKDTLPVSGFTRRRHITDTIVGGSVISNGWVGLRIARDVPAAVQQVTAHFDNIVFTDPIAPTVVCPSNINVNADASCQANVNFEVTSASDNCGTPAVTYATANGAVVSGASFALGTTTVTATATDPYGNTATCTFDVIVTDNTPPTITCPADITANADGSCVAVVTYSATASDNCGTPTISYSPASGSTFNLGTTTVTATATDGASNTATCTFQVTVVDNTPPTCSVANPVHLSADACAGNNFGAGNNPFTFSDNCGVTSQKYFLHPQNEVDCSEAEFLAEKFPLGLSAVRAKFSDAAGNHVQCKTVVGVNLCCPAVPPPQVIPEKREL